MKKFISIMAITIALTFGFAFVMPSNIAIADEGESAGGGPNLDEILKELAEVPDDVPVSCKDWWWKCDTPAPIPEPEPEPDPVPEPCKGKDCEKPDKPDKGKPDEPDKDKPDKPDKGKPDKDKPGKGKPDKDK